MTQTPSSDSPSLFAPGWLTVLLASLVAVGLCSACGGGGSGAGTEEAEKPATMLPSDGTPILLKIEGEEWSFFATCAPYRAGDYSGIVREGEITILSPSDGANQRIETLTGTWEQGSPDTPGTIEPLFFEMEGQGADSSGVSIQIDELCLEIENRDSAGNISGHIRRGNLTIGRQTPIPLQDGDHFTITPLH